MAMTSANWAEVLEPILRTLFDIQVKKEKDYMSTIYNVQDATKAQETHLGMGSMGLMDPWAGSISYETPGKGFKKIFTPEPFSKGTQIERFLVDDDQTGEIKKRVNLLTRSYTNTVQHYAASLFNHAFDGTMLGPDDKPLCSASHPISPGASTTWSNFSALALTADNLETVRTNMLAWTDDKGNPLGAMPDTIIVPPALRKTARMIAESADEPFVTDSGINVWKGALTVIEWPRLTDTNAWFVMDSMLRDQHLFWYWRRKGILEADGENFDTLVSKWRIWARFDYGYDDGHFCYGCNPS